MSIRFRDFDRIVFFTGAGMSAESGIPTFRGKEGYWTVGSREYEVVLASLILHEQLHLLGANMKPSKPS